MTWESISHNATQRGIGGEGGAFTLRYPMKSKHYQYN